MKKFPKIGQFRDVIQTTKHETNFNGVDEHGEPIYVQRTMPREKYIGTVKLHGTNAGINWDWNTNEITVQSRERVITVDDDNYGFAQWVRSQETKFLSWFNSRFDAGTNVTVYGEWCGGSIQKGVALSQLPKMFVIFSIHIQKGDLSLWYHADIADPPDIENVYSIFDFPTFEMVIDFNVPQVVQNDLIKITEQVEAECPVGKHLGVTGVGEGVVWSRVNDYRPDFTFKVKGEKHSVSKVKKLAPVDVERMNSIKEFIDSVVTMNRVRQAYDAVHLMNTERPTQKDTGDVIRWVFNDIMAEESDTIEANGFEKKELGKPISDASRKLFFEILDEEIYG